MKKAIVSAVVVGSLVLYILIRARFGTAPSEALGASTMPTAPRPTVTATPSATVVVSTATPSPSPTPVSPYKDGTYTGKVADAQWGLVQVQVIIQGGHITDVKWLQYPHDRSQSVQINSRADPILTQEAIQAQSAKVDIVSGATDSSRAFIASLSDALAQSEA